ncbi:MAG: hypothetical protein EZS28_034158, partial [Streblomastix strix]
MVIFQVGDIIKNQYILQRKIGIGAFGAIFSVKRIGGSQSSPEAMKLEKESINYSQIYTE